MTPQVLLRGPVESDEDWRTYAVCAQTDPELFFPEKGGDPWPAKQVCFQCPVQAPCLQYAVTHNEIGVWGGTSTAERQRPSNTAKPRDCLGCGVTFTPRKGQRYCSPRCRKLSSKKW